MIIGTAAVKNLTNSTLILHLKIIKYKPMDSIAQKPASRFS
jgi:hypothetical protein